MAQYNRGQSDREHFYRGQGWREPNQDWDRETSWERNRGPFVGMGPKGYQRSDERIYEDVCERLTWHGQIDARNIQVEVQNSEVTLTGSVDSRMTRRMAERILETVRGMKDIHNQLRVEEQERQRESGYPGGGRGRTDRVGKSGVYPASGPLPESDAEVQDMASWGQGERGAAGYHDSGSSEIHIPAEDRSRRTRRR